MNSGSTMKWGRNVTLKGGCSFSVTTDHREWLDVLQARLDERDTLERENAELRAALVEIANYSPPSTVQPVLIARAALAKVRA